MPHHFRAVPRLPSILVSGALLCVTLFPLRPLPAEVSGPEEAEAPLQAGGTAVGSAPPGDPSFETAGTSAAASASSPADTSLYITDVEIPTRDGAVLHGRVWRPDSVAGGNGGLPVVVSMTPYTLDDAHEYGRYFARHGFVYLNVDVRGRGSSEGTFRPLAQDGPDGVDVLRWAAEQPWSDGRVVMRGGSYRGMVQWQTLAAGPPEALKTVVPTAAVHPGWDYPNPSGIFLSYATRWLSFVRGNASQESLFGDSGYWDDRYMRVHREGRAFADLAEVTGLDGRARETFERWIQHPWYDRYWRGMNPDSSDYRSVEGPVLTITGYFDGDQPGAMKYYRDHMRWGRDAAKRRHYLVFGPWSHGGTRNPEKQLGGLTFADTAAIDMEGLHREWYDWVLQGKDRPAFLEDRVVYYVMGAGEWKSASALEAASDTTRSFWLASPGGRANDPFHSGLLAAEPPSPADVDSYTYDPRDTADVAGWDVFGGDYTAGGAAFLDGPRLVYHSPPLEAPVEVSGYMKLHAWIELDVPDTDLAAWVYEVRPDGTTIYLGRSLLRTRHRTGVDRSELVEPGRVLEYTFDRFYWFSRQLKEGSRIRLVITPVNTPALDKNYQSGGNTITETAADARTGRVRLHTGPDHPSRLVLPVAPGG